ncbi:nuclease-related domain-containing protein [Kitasatospora sp. GP82]|uniref:nuclease-related domain-containing protein n=1 Tax=Kitasatospora sp. GP82 TaxID=3035089 RepID=UPI002475413B|nr:nuclease-related domain-containing protein [Kitasatospora sp. GP82]MDH6128658.1 hypothetical protein [Kitasatospora sp. GP82]
MSTRARLTATAAGTAIGGILGSGSHLPLAILTAATGGVLGWALTSARTRSSGQTPDAGRWLADAIGEETTARILAPLTTRGWTILHDRSIPGSKANLDHIAIGPRGQAVVIDSRRWSAASGATVHMSNGRLWCGLHDRTRAVQTLLWETRTVSKHLGCPAVPVMVIHGAPVTAGTLHTSGVAIVGSAGLTRAVATARGSARGVGAASRAEACFPPYW